MAIGSLVIPSSWSLAFLATFGLNCSRGRFGLFGVHDIFRVVDASGCVYSVLRKSLVFKVPCTHRSTVHHQVLQGSQIIRNERCVSLWRRAGGVGGVSCSECT